MLVCVKHGHADQSARRWRRASQASQAVCLAKMLADGVGGQGAAKMIRRVTKAVEQDVQRTGYKALRVLLRPYSGSSAYKLRG